MLSTIKPKITPRPLPQQTLPFRIYYRHVPQRTRPDKPQRWAAKFIIQMDGPLTGTTMAAREAFVQEVFTWCRERFGKDHHGHPEKYRWHLDSHSAHFRHEAEAVEFKMRWC